MKIGMEVRKEEEGEEVGGGGIGGDGGGGGGREEGKVEIPPEDVSGIRLIFGSETFFATEILNPPGGLIFRGNLRGEPSVTLTKLEERLTSRFGDKYTLCLAEGEEDLKPMVVVVPSMRDRRPSTTRQRMVSIVAILATIVASISRMSTLFLGVDALQAGGGGGGGAAAAVVASDVMWNEIFLRQVVPLGLAIVAVVLLGTWVQRFVAKMWKTRLSPPIMLPSYAFGTYGAITNVTTPASSRDALFDIALSGTGSMLLASLVLFVIGLLLSTSPANVVTVPSSMLSDSLLLTTIAKKLLGPELLRSAGTEFVGLHWMSVLGANCATIAAYNLLPIRQLDGGRLVSAIYGRKTAMLASRITIFLLLMSTPNASHLLFFLAFVLFGPWVVDRPAKNELTEPGNYRAVIGLLMLFLMMLLILPKPTSMPLF